HRHTAPDRALAHPDEILRVESRRCELAHRGGVRYAAGRRRHHEEPVMTWLIAAIVGLGLLGAGAPAAAHDFYKDKTVRIVVGFTAGGGFDAYSRAIARHMGRHIPGHPTIIVENMPGAGSLISANYLGKIAKPDGLTIGHFIGGLL